MYSYAACSSHAQYFLLADPSTNRPQEHGRVASPVADPAEPRGTFSSSTRPGQSVGRGYACQSEVSGSGQSLSPLRCERHPRERCLCRRACLWYELTSTVDHLQGKRRRDCTHMTTMRSGVKSGTQRVVCLGAREGLGRQKSQQEVTRSQMH